jgi:nucleoside 2-deoxyribosyltransferase
MNVYIVAPIAESARAARVADELQSCGYRVVSTWHDGGHTADPDDPEQRREIMRANMTCLRLADVVLAQLDRGVSRCGLIEVGMALARGLPVILRRRFDDRPIGIAEDQLGVFVATNDPEVGAILKRLSEPVQSLCVEAE